MTPQWKEKQILLLRALWSRISAICTADQWYIAYQLLHYPDTITIWGGEYKSKVSQQCKKYKISSKSLSITSHIKVPIKEKRMKTICKVCVENLLGWFVALILSSLEHFASLYLFISSPAEKVGIASKRSIRKFLGKARTTWNFSHFKEYWGDRGENILKH